MFKSASKKAAQAVQGKCTCVGKCTCLAGVSCVGTKDEGKQCSQGNMKAVILNNKKLECTQVPKPQPEKGQVLIKLVASGVCHTDVHIALGEFPCGGKTPTKKNLILGHEAVGEVEELGSDVGDDFKIGDHVLVPWLGGTCGKCDFCIRGKEALCEQRCAMGQNMDGCFAEYMVANAKNVVHLPPGIDPVKAAPLACAGLTSYRALKHSGVRAGQYVAIIGAAGGTGHLAVQYALAMSMKVIAIDVGVKQDGKEEFLKKLGAKHILDATDKDLETPVNTIIPGGVHGSIVLAPCSDSYRAACKITRRGGTVMCVALPKDEVNLEMKDIVTKGLRLKGSIVGDRQDLVEALAFAADGKVSCMVTEVKLEDTAKVFKDLEKMNVKGRMVLLCGHKFSDQGQTKGVSA